jgi:hypothetical protein
MDGFSDACVPICMLCKVCEKEILQNQNGLRTLLRLLLRSCGIAQEVSKFGSNHDLMFLKSLGIKLKPHAALAVHVLEKSDLVLIGDVLPFGVVLPILAELMGVVALLLVGTEIHANAGAVLQRALIRQCFGGRSPLFDMEQAHLEALVQKLFLGLLLPLLLFAVWLTLSTTGAINWLGGTWFFGVLALWCESKSPPAALKKKLLAKAGTSLGMELSSTCSCIFLKNLDASFTAMVTFFTSNLSLATSILLVLIEFLQKRCKKLKKLVDFCHKKYWQVRNAIRIIPHPVFGVFVLDEFDDLPRGLVEEGLAC